MITCFILFTFRQTFGTKHQAYIDVLQLQHAFDTICNGESIEGAPYECPSTQTDRRRCGLTYNAGPIDQFLISSIVTLAVL